jgi:hypothetical protein
MPGAALGARIRQLLALGAFPRMALPMLRLACVFLVWIASTAWALDDSDADYDAELHEAYVLAWTEADDHQRRLLERAQRGWNDYRAANCELVGSGCYVLMAQERTAELRYVLTNTNVRTILHRGERSERSEGQSRPDQR